ncbi:MAG: glutamyl-tRNA reductase [Lachnospiraceae bacterium]|nr:glutamyl-tRNA reductase [Lachnospiraceae bacterium]MDE6625509.1 glutamyl-tRNA reductase [Lachnospiraceae bacterium]
MFCISVSFKKTSLEKRQQFAFSEEEQIAFLSGLIDGQTVTGGVVLSTCNRSELYFTGEGFESAEAALSKSKGVSGEEIKKYCLYYQGQGAVRHLFKVTCGLDSMVLGEDEILRQVKEAYLVSNRQGFTNGEINIIFQGAFNCAKLSKSETRLSSTPVSVGTLTANVIEQYLRKREQNISNGSGMTEHFGKDLHQGVLVIGAAGRIGSIVAKNLLAKGIPVIGTSRRHPTEEGMYLYRHKYLEWKDFDRRYEAVPEISVIVSATASPHFTLIKKEFLTHAAQGGHYLLIDLAVPRDIDRQLGNIEGVTLYDIDYFRNLSETNSDIRLGEVDKARHIMEECVEETLKKLCIREFQGRMKDKFKETWFQKMISYLRDTLDSEQLYEVLSRICKTEID